MNRQNTRPKLAMIVVLAFGASACGPTTSLEIGVQERQINVALAEAEPIVPPPAPAPAPAPRTTAPGFVVSPRELPAAQPAPRPVPTEEPPPVIIEIEEPEPVVCLTAHPEAAPEQPAPVSVQAPPTEGAYTFRQEGSVSVEDLEAVFSGDVVREVRNVEVTESVDPSLVPGNPPVQRTVTRYQVVETADLLTTITTYRVERNTSDGQELAGGIYIEQIINEGPFNGTVAGGASGEPGVESFTPSPPVQIAALPFAEPLPDAPPSVSSGVDPLTGLSLRVQFRTLGTQRIDACGEVVDSWSVEIVEGSEFVNPAVRRFGITGVNHFATGLGGLIVGSVIHLDGEFGVGPDAVPFQQRTTMFINQLEPTPTPDEADG